MTNNKPKVLYKYTTFEVGMKILESQTIRFSHPKHFNDPYDCNMPIVLKQKYKLTKDYFIRFAQGLKEHPKKELFKNINVDNLIRLLLSANDEVPFSAEEFIQSVFAYWVNKMRILSLSESKDNPLMWGHYAENNSGIVIEFDTKLMFFDYVNKVRYSKKVPKIDNIIIDDMFSEKRETFGEYSKLFLTKNINWKYEKEYRCLYDVELVFNYISTNVPSIKESHPNFYKELEYQNDFIHQPFFSRCVNNIYIGLNANIIDENKIINLAKNKYPNTKIYKANLSKKEFKIEFNPIN
jgi:hypothetical protein